LALYGEYGRVLAIGVIIERDGTETSRGVFGRERETGRLHADEHRTLRAFWKFLRDFDTRSDTLIGHNIYEFDLPFILKRSWINGIRPSVKLSLARYRSQPLYDTMKEFSSWDQRRPISLVHLAEVLRVGFTKTEGMDGGKVYDAFRDGRHDDIADYVMQDVEMVRAIYHRMNFNLSG
jgi:predicted PolB exonuclease-like 3'-5' exonuclease